MRRAFVTVLLAGIVLLVTAQPAQAAQPAGVAQPVAAVRQVRAVPAETGRYYVVGPPVDGQREYLYAIALRTLGNGNRFREIVELNVGRVQPDGETFTDGVVLRPGWRLVLPKDAQGQGVRIGRLPQLGPRSPAPASPSPRASAPSRPSSTPRTAAPSSAGPSRPVGTAAATTRAVARPPDPPQAGGGLDPLLIRVGAGLLAVFFAAVAVLLLRRGGPRRLVLEDDGPWPPQRHHTPTPAELAAGPVAEEVDTPPPPVTRPAPTAATPSPPPAPPLTRPVTAPARRPAPPPVAPPILPPPPSVVLPAPRTAARPTTPSASPPAAEPAPLPAAATPPASARPEPPPPSEPRSLPEPTSVPSSESVPGPGTGVAVPEAATPGTRPSSSATAGGLPAKPVWPPPAPQSAPPRPTSVDLPAVPPPPAVPTAAPAALPPLTPAVAQPPVPASALPPLTPAVPVPAAPTPQPGGAAAAPAGVASTGTADVSVGVELPRPAVPTGNEVPYLSTELETELGPIRVRLVGVAAGRGAPAYAWLGPDEAAPPATLPLVLGHRGPWRLHVDLGRAPDVLTLVGDTDDCRRTAVLFARRLRAGGIGVATVGDVFGGHAPEGCRTLPGLPAASAPDVDPPAPYAVFTTGLAGVELAGARRLATDTGGRCVPVVIGPVPAGRWSVQVSPVDGGSTTRAGTAD
ncbi:hypothetical protein [Micromonospora wenchangensis]|uniref:hypothetical protein n=1 Tax=Micromonospora wenchangensis TaxID=1185415 RepID=UPI0037F8C64C